MFGRNRLSAALVGVGAAVVLGIAPAGAAEIDDLKAKVEALEKKLSTSVSISGYVKGDFYLDNRNDLGAAFDAPGVRLDGAAGDDENDGAVGAHARQSRFRLSTSTDTSYGALRTVVETDFYGASSVLRLRHAYGVLGPVLAGQAWTLLSEEDTFADTVDFNGPAGTIWSRRPQLRLSLPLGEGFVGQMAVETPYAGNELPAFVAALRYRSGWGAVALAGSVGRIDEGGESEGAHALHIGGHLNVTDATQVVATLSMTSGLGFIWGGGSGTVMVGTDLKAQETMGGIAGASHGWSDTIRSGVYFGWAQTDRASGVPAADVATDNKSVRTVHANVIWSPVPGSDIGLEVMHGWREINAGTKGEATRVQIGVKYGF